MCVAGKRRWVSQEIQSERESSNNIFLSQSRPSTSSQAAQLTQRGNEIILSKTPKRLRSSQNISLQNISSQDMQKQEKMQIISGVIKYLLMAGRNKQPISKAHIIKNILSSTKEYSYIMKEVEAQLSAVRLLIQLFRLICRIK